MDHLISNIELNNWRNYSKLNYEFDNGVNWITGENGSGKTNLLEAIWCLAYGKSMRVSKHEEVVKWGEVSARVRGSVKQDSDDKDLEVKVWKSGEGRKIGGKSYSVNGVGRLWKNYIGNLMVVWFGPEDLDLVSGTGSHRRRFMDWVLGSEPKYARAISEYEQALKRRNKLLELLVMGRTSRQVFSYFDEILVSRGGYIHKRRAELVEFINNWWRESQEFSDLEMEYDSSEISYARLSKYARQEEVAGITLVGIQRDDVKIWQKFKLGREVLRNFGSRGQQRMGALGIKMAEVEFVVYKQNLRPVLLLDDVLSELDSKHKQIVKNLMNRQQTIVTAVERED